VSVGADAEHDEIESRRRAGDGNEIRAGRAGGVHGGGAFDVERVETRPVVRRQPVEPALMHHARVRFRIVGGDTTLVGEPDIDATPVEVQIDQMREHALGDRPAWHRAEQTSAVANGLRPNLGKRGGRDRCGLVGIHRRSVPSHGAGRRQIDVLFSRDARVLAARGGHDTVMRVALGADHAGVGLKQHLAAWLVTQGHDVLDLGTNSTDPVDYPDYAEAVGRAVLDGRSERGVIVCGSGVGAAIAANKLPGIRAGLCHDTYSAAQGVLHDDTNVLVLGARVIGPALAESLVTAFLGARFTNAERHVRRLAKVTALEQKALQQIPTGKIS